MTASARALLDIEAEVLDQQARIIQALIDTIENARDNVTSLSDVINWNHLEEPTGLMGNAMDSLRDALNHTVGARAAIQETMTYL